MKTPHQVRDYEQKIQKKNVQKQSRKMWSELEQVIQSAFERQEITSQGGKFELGYFNREDFPLIQEYCQRYGWNVSYKPVEDSSWSMTSKSEAYFTRHVFYLEPTTGGKP